MSDAHPSILLLFAHPAFEKSRINQRLVAAVRDLPGVVFRDLYELYPDFDIDVAAEQELVEAADLLVFHHPFFWYSTPALVKQWEDLVLEHGWAYGSCATALRGKRIMSAITAGGGKAAYRPDGLNRYTIRELLRPIEQTARLCGMDYLPPFVAFGTHGMSEGWVEAHATQYRNVLIALRDGTLDLSAVRNQERINEELNPELLPDRPEVE